MPQDAGFLKQNAKVLVVSMDNIFEPGFTSAMFKLLSEQSIELSVWCKEYSSEVARILPGLPRVFKSDPFWDKSPLRHKGSVLAFIKTALLIRKQGFQIDIIASHC